MIDYSLPLYLEYLAKKNLIETPNVDVIYNSIVIDFRAMANEKTDKITITLDMPDIDDRYYIIQFCDVMGYDIIPLTPSSDGIIKESTAIIHSYYPNLFNKLH